MKSSEGLNIEHYKERDLIIFGEEVSWDDELGGMKNFKELTLQQLETLKDKGQLKPDEQQNNSPTIEQCMTFMKQFPGATAHGYVISPERKDYRVTLEGLEFTGECTTEIQRAFSKLCKRANDLEITSTRLYCWFD